MLTKQQLEADVKRLEMAQGKEMVTVPWDIRRLKDVTHMALSSLSGGWRPIEEAPKNSQVILGFLPDRDTSEQVEIVYFDYDFGVWKDNQGEEVNPTMWMPRPALPAPPQVSQEGEL